MALQLTPEQRENARNLAAELELDPDKRYLLAQELVKLRQLRDLVRRHGRRQHVTVQHVLNELAQPIALPDTDLVADPDLERLYESCRHPRKR